MKPTITLKNLIIKFSLICFVLLTSITLYSQTSYNAGWTNIDVSQCDGSAVAKWAVYYDYFDNSIADPTFWYTGGDPETFGIDFQMRTETNPEWKSLAKFRLLYINQPVPQGYSLAYTSISDGMYYKLAYKEMTVYPYLTDSLNFIVDAEEDHFLISLSLIIKRLGDYVGEDIEFRLANGYWSEGGTPVFQNAFLEPQVALSSFNASNNVSCDGINLDWTQPLSVCSNSHVIIERNDGMGGSTFSQIAEVAVGNSPYMDLTAIPGLEYSYRAHLSTLLMSYFAVNNFVTFNEGPLSAIVTGTREAPQAPPPGFSVSTNNCTDKVALTWNFVSGTDSLEIFRDGTSVGVVAGNVTNFNDPVPDSDTGFSYTIRARNNCGWGEQSEPLIGVSPGLPQGSANLTATVVPGSGISLSWEPVMNVTGYKVERSLLGGGGSSFFEVPSGTTTYLDESLVACQTYEYRVRSVNNCSTDGVPSDSVRTASLVPDLLTTFASNALVASKGFYPNRVEISWTPQNNGSIINAYKIYRKQLGSDADSLQITSVNSGNNLYIDNFADAGVLYKYTIIGETQCESTTLYSNPAEAIGFRRPFGTVNGNVTYSGGIAVEGAKIVAATTSQIFGKSVLLNGNSHISIPNKPNLNPEAEVLLEGWFRSTSLSDNTIFFQKGNTYQAEYDAATASLEFSVTASDGQIYTLTHPTPQLTQNNYNHLAFQLYQDSLQIFLNGAMLESQFASAGITLQSNAASVDIGSDFLGQIDEVRIWNMGKDSLNMARDYSRLMLGGEPGLVAYLRMDEGAGNFAYDVSRNGNIFNRNHGAFFGDIAFSANIPSTNQLSIASYTNALGNYTLLAPYNGSGESFVFTPAFLTHQFNPSTRAIFIGDGSSVYNNIDFLDISSFNITGSVFYANTSCPAKGVGLFVDGNPVILDGIPQESASDGSFAIQVPIGMHHISVQKTGHVFSVGRFPETGKYNFQDDLVLGEFQDSTLITVVGRVVGGLREGNKVPGLGKSKNNIGSAKLVFKSVAGNGCSTDSVTTDILTGEYSIALPPLTYTPSVSVLTAPEITFGDATQLDLTNATSETTAYDTLYNSLGEVYQIDSVKYNKRLDYIYRINPIIVLKATDGVSPFIGDSVYTYKDDATSTVITRNLKTDPMRWPVFANATDGFLYRCMIWIYEPYVNHDGGTEVLDKVPTTDGQLIVTNELAAKQNVSLNLADVGEPDSLVAIVYSFPLGAPSFIADGTYPDYSYARRFEITLLTANNETINWNPGAPYSDYGDGKYHGYVLAGINIGNDFVTEGPQVPDYVLRDPPGSDSFASREVGTTRSTESQWNWSENKWAKAEDKIYVGVSLATGLGVSVNVDVEANVTVGLEASKIGSRSGTSHTTITNTQAWKTNSGTDTPGAGSDLYVGKTQNVEFGLAQHLTLVPDSLCTQLECLETFNNGFALAKTYGLSVKDGGYATSFIYSQNDILNYKIPDLINLRNIALQNDSHFQSNLPLSDPNYGRNNDDPVFGPDLVSTDTPDHGEYADFTGPSYTYTPVTAQDSVRDIVRFSNNQIKQWQKAIKLNEWEKINITNQIAMDSIEFIELQQLDQKYADIIEAFNTYVSEHDTTGTPYYAAAVIPILGSATIGATLFAKTSAKSLDFPLLLDQYTTYKQAAQRISDRFDNLGFTNFSMGGGNEYTASVAQEAGHSVTNSYDLEITNQLLLEVKATVSNVGAGFNSNVGTTISTGRDWTTAKDSSETVSFTLFDSDQGDQMNVDVYPSILGWGPIFIKQDGGRSSCPYEPQEVTQFYHPGSVISGTSKQIDKPSIAVSPAIITNTPVDQPAVFNLSLINESETGDTRTYNIQLVSSSNPFGAIAKIDGLSPATSATIPGGTAINKVLSIEKGPGPVYDYDSLLFVITAPCQYDAGTSNNLDIADSIYVSARFTPACTNVELQEPELQWVANNFNGNVVPTILSGYNINYFDLEHINLQYKPSNESQWINLETFYQDTTGFNDPTKLPISNSSPVTLYNWNIDQLTDGYYDLRLKSQCALADNTSVIHTGIIDRLNPHPFGSPSPADGILSPNDEISIKFNELIDQGSLTSQNFDIRGVLNGTKTGHAASLFFDGVDDYVEVQGGAALTNRDFTIQMAIKPTGSGERALFTQGTDPGEQLYLGLTVNNQIVFRINDQEVMSNGAPLANDTWHYIALAYSFENETAEIFLANETTSGVINVGNNSIFPNYQGSGRVWLGKQGFGDANWYHGNMHEVRVWDRTLSFAEFNTTMNRILGNGESGLQYNWRMDEVEGNLAIDHVRRRDATIFGPAWSVEPGGSAADFGGSTNYLKVQSGDVAITQEMDFTLEFWFRGSGNTPGVLFSNGKADGLGADSLYSWTLTKDAEGLLHLQNDGTEFLLSQNNYFDGQWHHLAVVMKRNANLSAIIDGNPQLSALATPFKQLSGASMYIGARGYMTGPTETVDNYFAGQIDEFRFWNSARKLEQIQRDKHNRMKGNEPSLKLYLPFENYELDPTGVAILTPSFDEQINSDNHLVEPHGTSFTDEVPTIKIQRPVEMVAFSWSVNNDQIILTTTTAPEMIENVTLDITVSNVQDLQGNVMASPATWIAYIDKNQVVWGDDLLSFGKSVGEPLSFSTQVVNQGGAAKAYTIQNLPEWLSVNPGSGTIPPNSSSNVNFTIDPSVNIGDYTRDIHLLTDFNFPEKLTVELKVRETPPAWSVDPAQWNHAMGIVGLIKIKDITSSDSEDLLAAFVNGELRGVKHLEYLEDLDRYLVFMDVYSNSNSGENLTFKIWDASAGIVYSDVTPETIPFVANSLVGTALDPQVFSSNYQIETEILIDAGYNWISQFLLNPDSTNFNILLESLTSESGDQLSGQTQFANYSAATGWNGPLQTTGLRPEQLNKLYISHADTLLMRGDIIDPSTRPITLNTGWNWIGFISIRNQGIDQALGNLDAVTGDQIKGRSQFSVYVNPQLGWQGTLQGLIPGHGYMYKSAQSNEFTYPFAGMFKSGEYKPSKPIDPRWHPDYAAFPTNMTVILQPSDSCMDAALDAGLLVGAFDESGQIRGISELVEIDQKPYSFLTIAGDTTAQIDLQWINRENGEIWKSTASVSYKGNDQIGTFSEPYILKLPDAFCKPETDPSVDVFSVYPTLFQNHLEIRYTASYGETDASIVIRDMDGRSIYSKQLILTEGLNQWKLSLHESTFASGAYVISLVTNENVLTEKIFKSR